MWTCNKKENHERKCFPLHETSKIFQKKQVSMLDSMYKSYMKKITLYNQRKIGRDHYFLPRKNHEIYFPRQLLSQPGQWTYSIKKSV